MTAVLCVLAAALIGLGVGLLIGDTQGFRRGAVAGYMRGHREGCEAAWDARRKYIAHLDEAADWHRFMAAIFNPDEEPS